MLSKNEILDLFPNNSFVKEVYLDWVDFMDLPISIKSLEMFILDVYFYARGNVLESNTIVKSIFIKKDKDFNWVCIRFYIDENNTWKENIRLLEKILTDFNNVFSKPLVILTQTINEYRRNTKSI